MKSDHWNFLANLLGTPGPAKPREDKKKSQSQPDPQATEAASAVDPSSKTQPDPSIEAAAASEKPVATEDTSVKSNAGRNKADEPAPQASENKTNSPSSSQAISDEQQITREDVLGALTATEPPKILPGFGFNVDDEAPTTLDQLTGSAADSDEQPKRPEPADVNTRETEDSS
jgi:hypothetical protein